MAWSEVLITVILTVLATAFAVGYIGFRYTRKSAEAAVSNINVLEAGSALIDVIATAGVIVDYSNTVVRSSASSTALGIVRKNTIVNRDVRRIVDETRKQGRSLNVELELPASGRKKYRLFSLKTVIASNRNVVILLDDMTESRRIENERRDFLANISHELKTPIGAIGLLAEALMDATDDPALIKKFSTSLRTESHRLGQLVQGIIQLSRVQTVDVLAEAIPIRVSDLIAEALDRCSVLANSKNVEFQPRCPDSIWVGGDVELLTVALKNLIDNAIHYSDKGTTVNIDVTATKSMVRVAVKDRGVGIPREDLERVFERFYRVDPSRSRVTGGTGLGLSIVKHITRGHGGQVDVESTVGAGTTFTIALPRFEPQQLGVSP